MVLYIGTIFLMVDYKGQLARQVEEDLEMVLQVLLAQQVQ
jgi:hypothetical protein